MSQGGVLQLISELIVHTLMQRSSGTLANTFQRDVEREQMQTSGRRDQKNQPQKFASLGNRVSFRW